MARKDLSTGFFGGRYFGGDTKKENINDEICVDSEYEEWLKKTPEEKEQYLEDWREVLRQRFEGLSGFFGLDKLGLGFFGAGKE